MAVAALQVTVQAGGQRLVAVGRAARLVLLVVREAERINRMRRGRIEFNCGEGETRIEPSIHEQLAPLPEPRDDV